jgi:hypothetical protein
VRRADDGDRRNEKDELHDPGLPSYIAIVAIISLWKEFLKGAISLLTPPATNAQAPHRNVRTSAGD